MTNDLPCGSGRFGGQKSLVVVPGVDVERDVGVDLDRGRFEPTGFEEFPHGLVAVEISESTEHRPGEPERMP